MRIFIKTNSKTLIISPAALRNIKRKVSEFCPKEVQKNFENADCECYEQLLETCKQMSEYRDVYDRVISFLHSSCENGIASPQTARQILYTIGNYDDETTIYDARGYKQEIITFHSFRKILEESVNSNSEIKWKKEKSSIDI